MSTPPAPQSPPPAERPRRQGWRVVKHENERGFEANFAPLRLVISRSELLGSVVELFLNALVGIGKIGFGAKPNPSPTQQPPPTEQSPTTPPTSDSSVSH